MQFADFCLESPQETFPDRMKDLTLTWTTQTLFIQNDSRKQLVIIKNNQTILKVK